MLNVPVFGPVGVSAPVAEAGATTAAEPLALSL